MDFFAVENPPGILAIKEDFLAVNYLFFVTDTVASPADTDTDTDTDTHTQTQTQTHTHTHSFG